MGDRDSLVVVEQNLLSVIDPTKRVPRRFDLGMSDFVGSDAFDENQDPTPRKLSLALKKRPKEPSSESAKAKKPRKALQASVSNEINEADYERMAVPFVPANTKKNNDWARKNFIAWRDARNAANPDNKCPEDLLYKVPFDIDALVYWLPRYVCETRTKAGNKYPASTLLCLLGGLLREMRSVSPDCPNFMDTSDSRFKGMHSIVDYYFRQLRNEGVGASVKHASLINKDEENILWQQGVLGDDTPERLLRAVFYCNGKNIASGATEMFRAGVPEKIIQEHTGHRSVKALRTYERTTATQHLSVANVLSSSSNVSFSDAKDKPPSANGTATAMSVNSTTGIPGIATMIGTASHCVINVNIGGPSMINTEKQREELQYEDKTP